LGLLGLEIDPLKSFFDSCKEAFTFLIIATAATWNFHKAALHHNVRISI
jgi:hypothetical protein